MDHNTATPEPDGVGPGPSHLLGRLTQRREYFCDTGAYAGAQYVRLDGYFTLEEYAKLLEYVNYAGKANRNG